MFAFYFLVIIAVILLWLLSSWTFKKLGNFLIKRKEKFINDIKEEEKGENKNE